MPSTHTRTPAKLALHLHPHVQCSGLVNVQGCRSGDGSSFFFSGAVGGPDTFYAMGSAL